MSGKQGNAKTPSNNDSELAKDISSWSQPHGRTVCVKESKTVPALRSLQIVNLFYYGSSKEAVKK